MLLYFLKDVYCLIYLTPLTPCGALSSEIEIRDFYLHLSPAGEVGLIREVRVLKNNSNIMSFANETIVETKICEQTGQEFHITDKDLEFYDKISPIFGWKKYSIPTPRLCPEARQQRRLSWRNERSLYKRTCDKTWENIISFISPDKPYPVYKREVWFTDAYNPCDYGIDFDFTKTFSEQFKTLLDTVPRFSIQQQDPMEASEYCNLASNCNQSYMITDSDFCEKWMYSNVLKHSNNCVDCSVVSNSEHCYELIDSTWCYDVSYSMNCIDCSRSQFLKDCISCKNCFGCSNVVNWEYMIFNISYPQDEYEEKLKELQNNSDILHIVQDFQSQQIHKENYQYEAENVTWNNIRNAKNALECYDVEEVEDTKYCDYIFRWKKLMDVFSFGENLSNVYETISTWVNTSRTLFSNTIVTNSHDI